MNTGVGPSEPYPTYGEPQSCSNPCQCLCQRVGKLLANWRSGNDCSPGSLPAIPQSERQAGKGINSLSSKLCQRKFALAMGSTGFWQSYDREYLLDGLVQLARSQVGIDLRHSDAAMAKQSLYLID